MHKEPCTLNCVVSKSCEEQKPKNFHRKARLVQTQWCLLARDLAMRNTGVKNRGALRLSHQSTEAA